jgi:protein-L-isoaspartate(D-aspartate) O-methyltransferase
MFDAVQNARLVANAERYYRTMYSSSNAANWNLRDMHMYETLMHLLRHHGDGSRAVVWAHNSHCHVASATEMGEEGEVTIGQLCRDEFGDATYIIGFGTHTGTVAAASQWDADVEIKHVVPSRSDSYEHLMKLTGIPRFTLPLRELKTAARSDEKAHALLRSLMMPRLERFIGVVYHPKTEKQSHYARAVLPDQFDEYVWFEETRAVTPLGKQHVDHQGSPETYPFGL